MTKHAIAISTGEPAGIGPDITIQTLCYLHQNKKQQLQDFSFVVLGDQTLLLQRAQQLGVLPQWQQLLQTEHIWLEHIPLSVPCIPGKLDSRQSPYLIQLLERASEKALNKTYAALVTAPIQKSLLQAIGFTGHTEYFGQKNSCTPVMMFVANLPEYHLRIALASQHLPLKEVAQAITIEGLVQQLTIIAKGLREYFGIGAPKILVCALNPHAGENGTLGDEEIKIIQPALALARTKNINASGPFPADTLFQEHYLKQADCVLAMYHDQGLIPIKYAGFGKAVNITLGLPFIRTSVDHGTALDLAATGRASCKSMLAATELAIDLIKPYAT